MFCNPLFWIVLISVLAFARSFLWKKEVGLSSESPINDQGVDLTQQDLYETIRDLQRFRDSLREERELSKSAPERLEKRLAVLVTIEEQLSIEADPNGVEAWKGSSREGLGWILPYCERNIEAIRLVLDPDNDNE